MQGPFIAQPAKRTRGFRRGAHWTTGAHSPTRARSRAWTTPFAREMD